MAKISAGCTAGAIGLPSLAQSVLMAAERFHDESELMEQVDGTNTKKGPKGPFNQCCDSTYAFSLRAANNPMIAMRLNKPPSGRTGMALGSRFAPPDAGKAVAPR